MELGIAGRRALVCASSKGLGRGCAEALAAEGVELILNARSADTLEVTAEEIRAVHGVPVTQLRRTSLRPRAGSRCWIMPGRSTSW